MVPGLILLVAGVLFMFSGNVTEGLLAFILSELMYQRFLKSSP